MARLEIEQRPDRSVLLTGAGRARWGVAALGLAGGAVLLAVPVAGGVTLLGSVVILPLGLIVLLAGIGALRHRDWVLLDRPARQIAYRRGLASIFRSVSVFSFDDVEAILVDRLEAGGEDVVVRLRRTGDLLWPVDRSADPAYVTGLVAAIQDTGGWPILRDGVPERRPYRVAPAGAG